MKKSVVFEKGSSKLDFRKYFFWAAAAVLVVLCYLILEAYLLPLISAFILAYLVRPVHKKLTRKFGVRLAAGISILLVLAVLVLPASFILGDIVQQAYNYAAGDGVGVFIQRISEYVRAENLDFESLSDTGVSYIAKLLTTAAWSLPAFLVGLFVTLFGMYYILVDWEVLALKLREYIPFKNKKAVSDEMSRVTNILVYGTLLIALIEFVVSSIGFYFAGVDFYLLLAAIVFIFAFIPGLGPTLVWVPLLIYEIVVGDYFAAAIVLLTGLALSWLIDMILRVKFLGSKANLNPVLMLVGILGGIALFGVFGFIIGPLVLIYTIELLEEGLRTR